MVDNPMSHENGCDCAVCDDIVFRRSLPAKCFVDNAGATDCDKLRQKVQAKHDANCLLRLLLETLPIQLEKHNLTHDRTACAMLIQDSIDYLFRDGEDTLVESPSNDEQQMLKMAYTMGQTTEQKLSEHLRKDLDKANKSLDEYRECVDKWRLWYDNASEDAKKWRRDAQGFYGALVKIAEYHGTKDEVWANNMRSIAKEALADRP
jgi:hypothetical protein